MGIALVGVSSPTQRGIEVAETGINVRAFICRYYPQWKSKLSNFQDQVIGFAIPDKFSREVRVSGELTGSTGIMAAVLNAAFAFANDVAAWVAVTSGSNAGGFYFDEFTESQTREGWRDIEAVASSDPLVT